MNSLVSIIIVNYNGEKWLKNCFQSILDQTYKNFEIILVDNASTDSSLDLTRKEFPEVVIVECEKNWGFAEGNNLGYEKARGDLILLLNNDTKLEKTCLEEFVFAFKNPDISIAQAKLVLMREPHLLDVAGSFWINSSLLHHIGFKKLAKDPRYNQDYPVFSAKGACMLVRRSVIDAIGFLDKDYWCYYEETDFCHRAWLSGFKSWYLHKPVCYHDVGATSLKFPSEKVLYHSYKNRLNSYIKNFQILNLLRYISMHILVILFFSLISLLRLKPINILALGKSIWWNLTVLKNTLYKRKLIQNGRKVLDKDYLKDITHNPKPSYYYYLVTDLQNYPE